jgi:hypothetical protein
VIGCEFGVRAQANFSVYSVLGTIPRNNTEKIFGVFLSLQLHPIYTPHYICRNCVVKGVVKEFYLIARARYVKVECFPSFKIAQCTLIQIRTGCGVATVSSPTCREIWVLGIDLGLVSCGTLTFEQRAPPSNQSPNF